MRKGEGCNVHAAERTLSVRSSASDNWTLAAAAKAASAASRQHTREMATAWLKGVNIRQPVFPRCRCRHGAGSVPGIAVVGGTGRSADRPLAPVLSFSLIGVAPPAQPLPPPSVPFSSPGRAAHGTATATLKFPFPTRRRLLFSPGRAAPLVPYRRRSGAVPPPRPPRAAPCPWAPRRCRRRRRRLRLRPACAPPACPSPPGFPPRSRRRQEPAPRAACGRAPFLV
mmetsp:Transcript_719/g.2174  ORF Transcript_719/g.2174 Transcript_719/m.2174 type:complete len:226 (-) Transcript_719:1753-2430(-)